MRTSLLKTNVARLRTFLGNKQPGYLGGIQQSDFANVCGLKLTTLQSIESQRLDLSPELALRILDATGVDLAWLLSKDLSAPIRARDGGEYSYDHYVAAQALKVSKLTEPSGMEVEGVSLMAGMTLQPSRLLRCLARLVAIVQEVGHRDEGDVELVYWKLEQLINSLQQKHSVESTGPVDPTIQGLVDVLALLFKEEDGFRKLEPLQVEARQRICTAINREAEAGRPRSQEDYSVELRTTYERLLKDNLPEPDPEALAALQGPSIEHIEAMEAKRAAEASVTPSPSTRRKRPKSA